MIRIGLIGVSGFGAAHYADIARCAASGSARLVAATVINPGQEAAKCAEMMAAGTRVFHDFRDMLDWGSGRIDLCCIPTGIHHHGPMTVAALRAGMHVLVEKPAAATIQTIRTMQDAERASGKSVAVGFQHLYGPEVAWMKARLLAGDIGRIRSIRGGALWPRRSAYYRRNDWAGRLRLGAEWILDSPANNALAHTLSLLTYLAGDRPGACALPESVEAELYCVRPGIEGPDTVSLRARTTSGIPLVFAASHATAVKQDPCIRIEGERGTMDWNLARARMEISGREAVEFPALKHMQLRARMFESICRRLEGEDVPRCDLEMASAHTLCVNGAHDATPTLPLSPEWVDMAPPGASPDHLHLSGIERLVPEALRHGKLFSELGAPWAQAAGSMAMSEYPGFPVRSDAEACLAKSL